MMNGSGYILIGKRKLMIHVSRQNFINEVFIEGELICNTMAPRETSVWEQIVSLCKHFNLQLFTPPLINSAGCSISRIQQCFSINLTLVPKRHVPIMTCNWQSCLFFGAINRPVSWWQFILVEILNYLGHSCHVSALWQVDCLVWSGDSKVLPAN